jgi:poly(3-hydroxybutyrate) depolymerase
MAGCGAPGTLAVQNAGIMAGSIALARSLILLLLLALAPNAALAAEMTRQTIPFAGADRTFVAYVPDSAGTSAPMLLLLHGSGGSGAQIAALWKDLADRAGIVLAAPDAWQSDGWRINHDTPEFLRTVVDWVEAKHGVDERRVYLFGQSGGAVYALIMAMLESRYFAGAAVHAGAWREAAEFRALTYAQRKIPLKIIVGDRDEFFSASAVRRTQAALQAAGFPVEIEIVPGQHHAYTAEIAPSVNDSAWRFLSSTKLMEPPVFTVYH